MGFFDHVNKCLSLCVSTTRIFTHEMPSWIRPFAATLLFLALLIFMLFLVPFTILMKLIIGKQDTFQNVRDELETVWKSESSLVALKRLRAIYQEIDANLPFAMSHLKGYKIAPYGNFTYSSYTKVQNLLYYWELQHQNWPEAEALCDDVLKLPLDRSEGHLSEYNQVWLVRKATIIANTKGKVAALEYLLPYADLSEEEGPVNRYLRELREDSFVSE